MLAAGVKLSPVFGPAPRLAVALGKPVLASAAVDAGEFGIEHAAPGLCVRAQREQHHRGKDRQQREHRRRALAADEAGSAGEWNQGTPRVFECSGIMALAAGQTKPAHAMRPLSAQAGRGRTSAALASISAVAERKLLPQLMEMIPYRRAALDGQQGFQLALDEFPIELGSTTHDD